MTREMQEPSQQPNPIPRDVLNFRQQTTSEERIVALTNAVEAINEAFRQVVREIERPKPEVQDGPMTRSCVEKQRDTMQRVRAAIETEIRTTRTAARVLDERVISLTEELKDVAQTIAGLDRLLEFLT